MIFDRRQLLKGGLVAAGATVAPSLLRTGVAAAATAASGTRFPGDPGAGHLYYGAMVEADISLPNLETTLGNKLTVRRSYFSPSGVAGLVSRAKEDHSVNRLPLCSIKCPGSWAAMAAGSYDSWLRDLLTRLQALGKPVMLCLHHEPEDEAGKSAGMLPSDYRAMQAHAITMAANVASRVTIVPILMEWTFDPRSGRKPSDWVVPSSKVFGFDVYNDWSPGGSIPWRTFADKASIALKYSGGKPAVVAEYGCHTDPSQPGRAAQWMIDAFNFSLAHNIAVMAYYDSQLHANWGDWRLDTERTQAMKKCLARSEVVYL